MSAGFESERLSMLILERQVQTFGAGFREAIDVDANVIEAHNRTHGQAAPVPVVTGTCAHCVLPTAGGADGCPVDDSVRGRHDAAGKLDMPTRVEIELAMAHHEVHIATADVPRS